MKAAVRRGRSEAWQKMEKESEQLTVGQTASQLRISLLHPCIAALPAGAERVQSFSHPLCCLRGDKSSRPKRPGSAQHWHALAAAAVCICSLSGALIVAVLLLSTSPSSAVLRPDSSFVERTTSRETERRRFTHSQMLWGDERPREGLDYPIMHWESERTNPTVLPLPWLIMQLHCDLALNSARHQSC